MDTIIEVEFLLQKENYEIEMKYILPQIRLKRLNFSQELGFNHIYKWLKFYNI